MMLVEDEQFAAFAPGLDAQFRERCVEALRSRGQWPEEAPPTNSRCFQ